MYDTDAYIQAARLRDEYVSAAFKKHLGTIINRLGSGFRAVRQRRAERARLRRAIWQLRSMNDHELADLAIARSGIVGAVEGWDVPYRPLPSAAIATVERYLNGVLP